MQQQLKETRKNKGYTQEKMSKLLGYDSASSYNMIESGKMVPPLTIGLRISTILGVPVEDLFSYEDLVHISCTNK